MMMEVAGVAGGHGCGEVEDGQTRFDLVIIKRFRNWAGVIWAKEGVWADGGVSVCCWIWIMDLVYIITWDPFGL